MNTLRNHTAVVATCGILLFAAVAHAGTLIDLASEIAPVIHGTSAEDQFGYCIGEGDLDGDGLSELVVGAPGIADSSGQQHAGAVFVFRFSDLDTLSSVAPATDLARWTLHGNHDQGRFGSALAVADLDADGFDDLAVGAPAAGDEGGIARGSVLVYFGGATDSTHLGPGAAPDAILTGAFPGARLGTSMLARDINGDGTAELVVSAPGGGGTAGARPGAAYVIEGTRLRSLRETVTASGVASATIIGENAGDELTGLAVADTDGDGGLELILGAGQAEGDGASGTDAGRLYVVAAGDVMGRTSPLTLSGTRALPGVTERGFFGRSVSASDIDYDGVDDLLVSAYASKAGGDRLEATGEAFVLFGGVDGLGAGGVAGTPALESPAVPRFHGASVSDLFGLPVLLADVTGDGAADIVTASTFADGPDDERNACGEVYVYRGSLRSVMAAKAGSAELADVTVAGASPEDAIGGALFLARFSESEPATLLIGAPDAPAVGPDGETSERAGKLILLSTGLLRR